MNKCSVLVGVILSLFIHNGLLCVDQQKKSFVGDIFLTLGSYAITYGVLYYAIPIASIGTRMIKFTGTKVIDDRKLKKMDRNLRKTLQKAMPITILFGVTHTALQSGLLNNIA